MLKSLTMIMRMPHGMIIPEATATPVAASILVRMFPFMVSITLGSLIGSGRIESALLRSRILSIVKAAATTAPAHANCMKNEGLRSIATVVWNRNNIIVQTNKVAIY